MEAPILAGIIMILIGLWQLLDRARLGLVVTRALGQYWGNRAPTEESPEEAVAPVRGWYGLSGIIFLILGVVAIVSGLKS